MVLNNIRNFKMPKQASKKINFKEAYQKLQDIIDYFNDEDFDLDIGIQKFEQGQKLAKEIRGALGDAENRVKKIRLD